MENEINIFTNKMIEKYNKKIISYGHNWKTCEIEFLDNRLTEEFIEYQEIQKNSLILQIFVGCYIPEKRLNHDL